MNEFEIGMELRKVKTIIDGLLAKMDSAIKPRTLEERDALVDADRCLHCEKPFNGKKNVRGMHEGCRNEVKLHYTDEELMAANRLLEAGKGGRPKGDVKKALEEAVVHVEKTQAKSTARRNNKKP